MKSTVMQIQVEAIDRVIDEDVNDRVTKLWDLLWQNRGESIWAQTCDTESNLHPDWRVHGSKLLLQGFHGAFNKDPYKVNFSGVDSEIEITYGQKVWIFTSKSKLGSFKKVPDSTYLILDNAYCRASGSDNWWLMTSEERIEVIEFLDKLIEVIQADYTERDRD